MKRRAAALACLLALAACAPTGAALEHAASPRPAASAGAANKRVSPARCARAAKAREARRRAVRRRAARPRICARFHRGRVVGGARSLGADLLPAAALVVPPAASAPRAPAPGPAATPTPTPDGPSLPEVPSDPFAVQVQAVEYALQLSKAAVSAGSVRVELNLSRAEDPHNLVLVREDGTGPLYAFDEQPAGAVVTKKLPLTAGRWTLFCSLPNHAALGMQSTLSVD
jgi:hypothetical protein